MTPEPATGPAGGTVYRVVWIPGTDRLRGWCWCGADQESEDPVELWEWLLAHPGGHSGGTGGDQSSAQPPAQPPAPLRPVGV